MTVPIPIPLPPWAKFLLRYGPAAGGFLWALVDYLREEDDGADIEWRRLMVRFQDLTSAEGRDNQFCTFDLVNVTGGAIDTSWTTTDYTNAESEFDGFFNTYKTKMSANLQVDQYRWYKRAFNDYTSPQPFVDSGPPVRVTAKTISGTGTGGVAAQVALSVTEKTPWPKHWGRFYLPGMVPANVAADGRWNTSAMGSVLNDAWDLYGDLMAFELYPVVPVTQVAKDPLRALLGVTQLQIDDIPDVVRRRRLASVASRQVLP